MSPEREDRHRCDHPDRPHPHPDGLNWIYDGQARRCVRFVPFVRRPWWESA
jgi:hypothetical protein